MARPTKPSPIRDYIQYQLKQHGLTQNDAADALHVSHQTLCRKLNNPQTLLVTELMILAKLGQFDPLVIMTALADSRRRKLEVTLSA